MREIRVGGRVDFVPAVCPPGKYVTGTIVYINEPHRFCQVAYPLGKTVQHECFKIFKREDHR